MLCQTILASLAPLLVLAQDGTITGPTTSPEAAGYSCDASKCQLPDCHCASTEPPGGLDPSDTPQFIVFTADDAVQTYTLSAINQFLAHRQNPNGCQPKTTYYASLNYTNYALITDWYVAGNEIADHTMTHQGKPSPAEINGNLIALNALAGIPLSSIKGFRAPYLDFSVDTLKHLADTGFTYDSSASASIAVTDEHTDAYWPYTLDNGMANNCLSVPGLCRGEPKLPGFWEVPMYAFFDNNGPHLMDPWLDNPNGETSPNDTATLEYMQRTFTDHYNGNRQPIGLYTHPIHLAPDYPNVRSPNATIRMINRFLDWAQERDNVWIVSTEQLLEWVRNPVPVGEMNNHAALGCSIPDVPYSMCNGMPDNEQGLIDQCTLPDFSFSTCYGCPVLAPTPQNPNPKQNVPDGGQPRFRVPDNCSTEYWDPIQGVCTCTSSSCEFEDESRPIGPDGADFTGGGTGGAGGTEEETPQPSYVPFNGATSTTRGSNVMHALLVGLLGASLGALGVFVRA